MGVGAVEVAGWVVCGAELLEAGASAGGVSGWVDEAAAFAAGLGEVMISKRAVIRYYLKVRWLPGLPMLSCSIPLVKGW